MFHFIMLPCTSHFSLDKSHYITVIPGQLVFQHKLPVITNIQRMSKTDFEI